MGNEVISYNNKLSKWKNRRMWRCTFTKLIAQKSNMKKLQSVFRIRWHSLDTSEVTGLLSHTYTHTKCSLSLKRSITVED